MYTSAVMNATLRTVTRRAKWTVKSAADHWWADRLRVRREVGGVSDAAIRLLYSDDSESTRTQSARGVAI